MNNKVRYNTYSRNVYNPNNQITGMINRPIDNLNSASVQQQQPYDKNKNIYFSGSDLSGTVWLGNPNSPKYYDVPRESPGISWIL
jgi:hypothetical protein